MISVVVPCFNETDTILTAVREVAELRDKLELEIIVVDDGSSDGSFEKLRQVEGIVLERHPTNHGKGAALATGAALAKGEVLVIQDADLEYDAKVIPGLVEPILNGRCDIVYSSRFKGTIEGMSLSHLIGNKILTYFARLICGANLTDLMGGQKAFRTEVFRSFDLQSQGFEVDVEFTVQALRKGYSILEIPIPYSARKLGKAKIGWSDGFKSIMKLFRGRYGV